MAGKATLHTFNHCRSVRNASGVKARDAAGAGAVAGAVAGNGDEDDEAGQCVPCMQTISQLTWPAPAAIAGTAPGNVQQARASHSCGHTHKHEQQVIVGGLWR